MKGCGWYFSRILQPGSGNGTLLPKIPHTMSDKQRLIDEQFEKLRSALMALTELNDLEGSPYRFLAILGTQETDPEDGESYISSEIYSAAGTEDLGEMLATLIGAALEEEEDNPSAQQYLVESVLMPVRELLDEDEEE